MINRPFENVHSYSGKLSKTGHSGRATLQEFEAIDDFRRPTCTQCTSIVYIIASYFFVQSFLCKAQICLARWPLLSLGDSIAQIDLSSCFSTCQKVDFKYTISVLIGKVSKLIH